MTQLEKIRKAKCFLQEDVAKASGVNTSITDVGPKLTVANDSKTENKIINLRKSLNTLANDEGEEISQFFQANLDAGIIDEDMLHIFDDYINGEENAMGKDTSDEGEQPSDKGEQLRDKGEEEPIPQFFQSIIDAGFATADMMHIFDNPSEVEENAKGEEPSNKGDEPLPQFYQAMIDAGVVTADELQELNSLFKGEKGEEKATDAESDDGEIENLINTQTLEKEAKAATEAEDKLMKIIDLLGEKEQKQVKTHLTKHPTDKEFLLGLLGKHPKLLFSEVSDKSSKSGTRLIYYVISDADERPTRVAKILKPLLFKLQVLENGSDVIRKLDEYNKERKKVADAARKEILGIKDEDEEDDKYKSEITDDDCDDYLAEVKKEEGREYANEVANLLFSNAPAENSKGKTLALDNGTLLVEEDGSPLEWDALIRKIVFRDLQLDYNINLERLEKEFNLFDDELDIVKDYYYTLWDKFQGQEKRQLIDARSKVLDEIKGKGNEKSQEQTDAVDTDGAEGNINQEDVEAATALVIEWGEKFF